MELSRVHLCLEILIDLTLGASWRREVVACDRKISAAYKGEEPELLQGLK